MTSKSVRQTPNHPTPNLHQDRQPRPHEPAALTERLVLLLFFSPSSTLVPCSDLRPETRTGKEKVDRNARRSPEKYAPHCGRRRFWSSLLLSFSFSFSLVHGCVFSFLLVPTATATADALLHSFSRLLARRSPACSSTHFAPHGESHPRTSSSE